MASRRGYSAFFIAASLLMLSGLSVLYLGTDGSDATEGDYGNFHWVMDDGKNLTVTGHGDLNIFQSGWNGLVTLTLVPDGAVNIGDYVLQDCDSLETVTIAGPITPPIGEDAFLSCNNLMTVNIACNDPLGITAQSSANGYIAYYADTVNHVHRYSASYDWADDGSSCTVHIVCANTSDHDHDVTDSLITSTVKIPPTATEKGTTEYTVSGTYDGFSYSDTKDIQDIPATGGDSGGKDSNILIYVVIAVIAALAIAGGAFLYIRSRR